MAFFFYLGLCIFGNGILGGGIPDRPFYPHHHAKFDVDESAMRKGTEFICRYVCDFLK